MMNTENALKQFIKRMEIVLYKHQRTKGDSWQDCDLQFLLDKLEEEIKEFKEETKPIRKADELIDIANICVFLHERYIWEWAKSIK